MSLMEVKKSQTSTSKSSRKRSSRSFIGEVKEEIGRINWTSKEELKVYTKIVMISVFALGLGIFAVDMVIQACLDGLTSFVYMVGG